jgi:hypothetical protein
MKRLVVIFGFAVLMGCATVQNKPLQPPEPDAAIDLSQKETNETVGKAFWILIDIGSSIAAWSLFH